MQHPFDLTTLSELKTAYKKVVKSLLIKLKVVLVSTGCLQDSAGVVGPFFLTLHVQIYN
jgi:hypothetical protein